MQPPVEFAALDLRALTGQYFLNSIEIYTAYCTNAPLPVLRLKNGIEIHHDPADPIADLFAEIFVAECYTGDGFYQPAPGDTVLDLGANIGMFALYLAGLSPDVRIVCFEPCADTFQRLCSNIGLNCLGDRIQVFPYAISSGGGKASIRLTDSSGDRSLFDRQDRTADATAEVTCIPLSRAIEISAAAEIALLKVDIEGAEIEMLQGAESADWVRVRRVALEYHDFFRPGCRAAAARLLTANGYDIVAIESPVSPDLQGVIRANRSEQARK